jgi:hypothetical protein
VQIAADSGLTTSLDHESLAQAESFANAEFRAVMSRFADD